MKVLISDYADCMMPDHELEITTIKSGLGEDTEIEVYAYTDEKHDEFVEKLSEADGLLTAFIKIDAQTLRAAKNLKVIALNSTGWDSVDLETATELGIKVCPVGEYCTRDVSESAVAYTFALSKQLKYYDQSINRDHKWDYSSGQMWPRVEESTVAIIGFGKIGKCTASKLSGIVKQIIACDPYIPAEVAQEYGIELVDKSTALQRADIIINHMNLTGENQEYFDSEAFAGMAKKPLLINLGRGLCVDEAALVKALDEGQIRGFAADVLIGEPPILEGNPLLGRDNVIITPHSSFYSLTSIQALERLSSLNLVYVLTGQLDKVFKLVN